LLQQIGDKGTHDCIAASDIAAPSAIVWRAAGLISRASTAARAVRLPSKSSKRCSHFAMFTPLRREPTSTRMDELIEENAAGRSEGWSRLYGFCGVSIAVPLPLGRADAPALGARRRSAA
jgi:hypothetical protein